MDRHDCAPGDLLYPLSPIRLAQSRRGSCFRPFNEVMAGSGSGEPEDRSACLVADGFNVDGDLDLVADHDAAGFESGIPDQAKFLAAELSGCGGADTLLAPGVLDLLSGTFYIECDLAGNAVNGEFTDCLRSTGVRLNLLAVEGQCRELLDFEEVGAFEVGVAVVIAGIDGGGIDGGVDIGTRGIFRVVPYR